MPFLGLTDVSSPLHVQGVSSGWPVVSGVFVHALTTAN